MTRIRIAAAIAALTFATAAPALADQRAGRTSIGRLDADNNGTISRQEWPFRPERFDIMDIDKDGALTLDELSRRTMQRPRVKMRTRDRARVRQRGARAGRDRAARVRALDADGNGVISRQEWRQGDAVFDRLDQNRDGVLTPAEVARPSRRVRRVR